MTSRRGSKGLGEAYDLEWRAGKRRSLTLISAAPANGVNSTRRPARVRVATSVESGGAR
jgi:hypothetical protein